MAIEKLIAAAAQFDADFPNRIVGASAEEIARLEAVVARLSGLMLPSFYKEYLSRLGRHDGGLRPPSEYASMKLSNLIEYYEDVERDGSAPDMLPERCVVFGYTGVGLFDLSFFFSDDGEPSILFTSADEIKGECAETLEKMLHQIVFRRLRMRHLTFLKSYLVTDSTMRTPALRNTAQGIGFQREWFGDHITECGVWGGVCLMIERTDLDSNTMLVLGGNDRKEVDRAASVFTAMVAMALQGER